MKMTLRNDEFTVFDFGRFQIFEFQNKRVVPDVL